MLPKQYAWLTKEGGPKMLVEALKLYGTIETPGKASNPTILAWAKETGLGAYSTDSIPWCGLFVAVVALRAGWARPPSPLWALDWLKFGAPTNPAMLGDVLVFKRDGGGHVGLYVGEDKAGYYHVLGGNQSDAVNIKRIEKKRCVGVRRPKWRIAQPANVRKIVLSSTGSVSTNEA